MSALTDTLARLSPAQAHWFAERVLGLTLVNLHNELPGFCPCGALPDDPPAIPSPRQETA